MRHVLFLNLFYCYFFVRLLVDGKFNESELSLAESFILGVEIEHVRISSGLVKPLDPLDLVLLLGEKD